MAKILSLKRKAKRLNRQTMAIIETCKLFYSPYGCSSDVVLYTNYNYVFVCQQQNELKELISKWRLLMDSLQMMCISDDATLSKSITELRSTVRADMRTNMRNIDEWKKTWNDRLTVVLNHLNRYAKEEISEDIKRYSGIIISMLTVLGFVFTFIWNPFD